MNINPFELVSQFHKLYFITLLKDHLGNKTTLSHGPLYLISGSVFVNCLFVFFCPDFENCFLHPFLMFWSSSASKIVFGLKIVLGLITSFNIITPNKGLNRKLSQLPSCLTQLLWFSSQLSNSKPTNLLIAAVIQGWEGFLAR